MESEARDAIREVSLLVECGKRITWFCFVGDVSLPIMRAIFRSVLMFWPAAIFSELNIFSAGIFRLMRIRVFFPVDPRSL